MQDALLEDIYNALADGKNNKKGYYQFKKDFPQIVKKRGWRYKGAQNWRSKVIWETNHNASYNAARYQQQQKIKKLKPYLSYQHSGNSRNPRPQHLSWNGLTLPQDDPFWDTHYPPNGWGCRCRAVAHSKKDLQRQGRTLNKSPKIEYETKTIGIRSANPRTIRTPKGISPGFAYNPGKAFLEPFVPRPQYYSFLKTRGYKDLKLDSVPMPKANKITKEMISKVTNEKQAFKKIDEFLRAFGTKLGGKPIVFKDVAGTGIVMSDALFFAKDPQGKKLFLKAIKDKRLDYTAILANTIIRPDEIWQHWEKGYKNKWKLKRRYLKSFLIEGTKDYGIAAFEWDNVRRAWQANTVFTTYSKAGGNIPKEAIEYFLKQRVGVMLYKRR
jgi:SPP1 gp7 family putative phage head morphogenesis protein